MYSDIGQIFELTGGEENGGSAGKLGGWLTAGCKSRVQLQLHWNKHINTKTFIHNKDSYKLSLVWNNDEYVYAPACISMFLWAWCAS